MMEIRLYPFHENISLLNDDTRHTISASLRLAILLNLVCYPHYVIRLFKTYTDVTRLVN